MSGRDGFVAIAVAALLLGPGWSGGRPSETAADEPSTGNTVREAAIRADRSLLAGEWRIVGIEANGNANIDPVPARVTVVNGVDGRWSLLSNGRTIAEGTSTIDPTTHPKLIELRGIRGSIDAARGRHYRGIYEVHEQTRRICIVPADATVPKGFDGSRETGQILVTFERVVFE